MGLNDSKYALHREKRLKGTDLMGHLFDLQLETGRRKLWFQIFIVPVKAL